MANGYDPQDAAQMNYWEQLLGNTDQELYGRGGYEIPGVRPTGPAYTPEGMALRRALGIEPEEDEATSLLQKLSSPAEIPQTVEPEKGKLGQNIGMLIADALLTYASGQNPNVRPQHFFARAQELRREQAEDKTRRATSEALMKKEAADRSAAARLEEIRSRRGERREDVIRSEADARRAAEIAAANARADAAEQTRIREREEDTKMGLLDAAASEGVEVTDQMSRGDIRNAIARSRRERRMQEVGRGNTEKLEMADREASSAGEELFNVYLFGDQAMGVPPISEQLKSKKPEQLIREFERRLAPLNVPEETRRRLIFEFKKEIDGLTFQEQGPMPQAQGGGGIMDLLRAAPGGMPGVSYGGATQGLGQGVDLIQEILRNQPDSMRMGGKF